MKTIEFTINENKEELSVALDLVNKGVDLESLNIFDKYFVKFKTKNRSIMFRIDNTDEGVLLDKVKLNDWINKNNPSKYEGYVLYAFLELYRKLNMTERKIKIGAIRNSKGLEKQKMINHKHTIDLDAVIYEYNVNKNRHYNKTNDLEFKVRGHYRKLKSGKKVFVKPYNKKFD